MNSKQHASKPFGWLASVVVPRQVSHGCDDRLLAYRLVDLVKSLLGKGGTTDFLVRQWGIRRTRKSVVPLNQQPVWRAIAIGASLTRRVTISAWHERARS